MSPCGVAARRRASQRVEAARSGAAPSSAKAARAASSSSAAVSSSPSSRQASADELARARRLVGRVELLPGLRRAPERGQRAAGVAAGQLDRAARLRGHRAERAASLALGDRLELAAGRRAPPRGRRPRA